MEVYKNKHKTMEIC